MVDSVGSRHCRRVLFLVLCAAQKTAEVLNRSSTSSLRTTDGNDWLPQGGRSEHPESIQRQLAGFRPEPSQLFHTRRVCQIALKELCQTILKVTQCSILSEARGSDNPPDIRRDMLMAQVKTCTWLDAGPRSPTAIRRSRRRTFPR